nr:hypothetical protein CFP56_54949 [Quercus suber]
MRDRKFHNRTIKGLFRGPQSRMEIFLEQFAKSEYIDRCNHLYVNKPFNTAAADENDTVVFIAEERYRARLNECANDHPQSKSLHMFLMVEMVWGLYEDKFTRSVLTLDVDISTGCTPDIHWRSRLWHHKGMDTALDSSVLEVDVLPAHKLVGPRAFCRNCNWEPGTAFNQQGSGGEWRRGVVIFRIYGISLSTGTNGPDLSEYQSSVYRLWANRLDNSFHHVGEDVKKAAVSRMDYYISAWDSLVYSSSKLSRSCSDMQNTADARSWLLTQHAAACCTSSRRRHGV